MQPAVRGAVVAEAAATQATVAVQRLANDLGTDAAALTSAARLALAGAASDEQAVKLFLVVMAFLLIVHLRNHPPWRARGA